MPLFCESDEPEVMMQACLQIMAPGDRTSSSAKHERTAGATKRGGRVNRPCSIEGLHKNRALRLCRFHENEQIDLKIC